ncbi:MAG: hypothetical protein KJT03_14750, partial [Verrucomicrobiae bacterium]|nr:hypothetical protein [Verrucomicrobiae bacterium]
HAMSMDFLPTIADYCGVKKLPAGVEGKTLRPMLEGKDVQLRDAMFWNMTTRNWAIRQGPWKLLFNPRDDTQKYPELDTKGKDRYFLANLEMDRSESTNLLEKFPDKGKELLKAYSGWNHALPTEPMH